MQTYETLFVTAPTLTEDEEKTTVEGLSQVVSDLGGTMVANERMGRRRLAYPIQKHNDGVYVRFLYDSEAAVPKELERRLRLSDKILRVLTVRMDGNWATFSKEQAVRDAEARVEAAKRAIIEAEEQAVREAEEKARREAEGEEGADAEAAPKVDGEAAPKAEVEAAPKAETDGAKAATDEPTEKTKGESAPATEDAGADSTERTEE